jgi:hypothetical protein
MAQLQRQVRQLRMLLLPQGETGQSPTKNNKENVKVICRFRPQSGQELSKKEGGQLAWDFAEAADTGNPLEPKFDEVFSVQQDKHDKQHVFRYDHVLRPEASINPLTSPLTPLPPHRFT